MEKRFRQRVRDQVALIAFGAESLMRSSARGYPSWPGTETFRSRAGYRSARPITARSSLSACNARPVHTEGPLGDIALGANDVGYGPSSDVGTVAYVRHTRLYLVQ